MTDKDAERVRLDEDSRREKNWKRWGPYLPERQWGTVREDYSPDGAAWDHFPHEHARSRVYRWGEDGLLGFTDRECRLCFAPALWNGNDPILKERLFGLSGPEGNHGEDVKEIYFYLDSTPTHSYCKALYRYPIDRFPYDQIRKENARRGKAAPEYEVQDSGVFDDDRFFDLVVEYAKAGPDDVLVRLTVTNHHSEDAPLQVLPTVWFRNVWAWGCSHEGCGPKGSIKADGGASLSLDHPTLGPFRFDAAPDLRPVEVLFTENETNYEKLFGTGNPTDHVKDAFHERVVEGRPEAVSPDGSGTKAAFWYDVQLGPGASSVLRFRLHAAPAGETTPGEWWETFDEKVETRIREADEFYRPLLPADDFEAAAVVRHGYAGLLWSKQFYHYSVRHWLDGDPLGPKPSAGRKKGRNSDWRNLFNKDVVSMPDKWEYPWYAAWDLAFHMVPFCKVDPNFAKEQLVLLLREWYMHPNGQIPAYEYAFGDVNPPVHAWAVWRVYKLTAPKGERDIVFLKRTFNKLLLNFTWWVNRKDVEGRNLFSGGFLGMDNIGVWDRSAPPPDGQRLEQADATAWMAFYCATMLAIALEIAATDPAYEDTASKFFEHFVAIIDAIGKLGGAGMWDEEDGFYYDQLLSGEDKKTPIRLKSLVGLVPLLAVQIMDDEKVTRLPGFAKRMNWFLAHSDTLSDCVTGERGGPVDRPGRIMAIPSRERLVRLLGSMLDEEEFLSPYGIRSLSKRYANNPFKMHTGGQTREVAYAPGEDVSGMFGGNSNWRGPVWWPLNFLIVEALERYHYFYGEGLKVEMPSGSGVFVTLGEVAAELKRRLASLFLPRDGNGAPPWCGDDARWTGEKWRGLTLFHEYFHAETGRGCGASHQTGWTALVALYLGVDRPPGRAG